MLPDWRIVEIRQLVADFQYLPGGYARRCQEALVALLGEREGLVNALLMVQAGVGDDSAAGSKEIARKALLEEL